MDAVFMISLWTLFSLFVETTADVCNYGEYSSIICIFGCCTEYDFFGDDDYAYCCLSNGAGISIICACVAVVLSVIGCCCRRARYRTVQRRPPAVIYHHAPPSVSVVSTTADHYAYDNSWKTDTSAPPPPYPGLPATSASAYENKV